MKTEARQKAHILHAMIIFSIVGAILKLIGLIDWAWWVILAPITIIAVLAVLAFVVIGLHWLINKST